MAEPILSAPLLLQRRFPQESGAPISGWVFDPALEQQTGDTFRGDKIIEELRTHTSEFTKTGFFYKAVDDKHLYGFVINDPLVRNGKIIAAAQFDEPVAMELVPDLEKQFRQLLLPETYVKAEKLRINFDGKNFTHEAVYPSGVKIIEPKYWAPPDPLELPEVIRMPEQGDAFEGLADHMLKDESHPANALDPNEQHVLVDPAYVPPPDKPPPLPVEPPPAAARPRPARREPRIRPEPVAPMRAATVVEQKLEQRFEPAAEKFLQTAEHGKGKWLAVAGIAAAGVLGLLSVFKRKSRTELATDKIPDKAFAYMPVPQLNAEEAKAAQRSWATMMESWKNQASQLKR